MQTLGHRTIPGLPKGVGDLWVPLLVAALGVALSLFGWGRLVDERRDVALSTIRADAIKSRGAVANQIERRLDSLQDLARFWGRFGRQPIAEWRVDSDILMKSARGVDWLLWVGAPGEPLRFAARDPEARPDPAVAAEARTHWDHPVIEGPAELATGYGFLVFVPVRGASAEAGQVLVASIHTDDLLAPLFPESATAYATELRWGDTVIYRSGEADPRAPAWWLAESEVHLSLGPVWTLTLRPTDAMVAAVFTPLPNVLLASGVLLSILLGALVHQMRLNRRTIRFLDSANRALDSRIQEAAQKDSALRLLNQQLEARVAARTAALNDAVDELEAFNFSVSHDLRSPLGAILNFSALLEEDSGPALDDSSREMLGRIRRSATAALELLQGLLALSHASRDPLERTHLDMTKVAREAFASAAAGQADVDVELVIEDLPPAHADHALVSNVLSNLFSNALKYSRGREKRRIVVTGRREGNENIYVIADNGVGFDMRFAKKLFGVFERLHRSDQYEGTGVGLAMVARIVRRHGGRVWAESQPGSGARIYFTLPRSDA
jgi:signal transduction histidine kinase